MIFGFRMKCLLLLLLAVPASAADVDLLRVYTPSQLAAIQTKNAAVFQNRDNGALTITFWYTDGEPEVRIPVASMNWPANWSRYKALEYTFSTSSIDGAVKLTIDTAGLAPGEHFIWVVYGQGKVILIPITIVP